MNWIDHVCATTAEYIEQMPKSQRKEHGQFFTSKDTAVFMASLFTIQRENNSIRVLDPGAGSGILSVAILERLEKIEEVKIVDLVCYETDPNIFDLLKSNLEWVCSQSTKKITYRIVTENYIVSQLPEYNSFLGFDPEINKFDIVIGNPPYKKIAKKAPEAQAMPNICYGAPNLYFLFAAMSIFNLKYSGEMVVSILNPIFFKKSLHVE